MKKISMIILLIAALFLHGCERNKTTQGLPLPCTQDQVELVSLIYHTGDPSNANEKWIIEPDDIHYFFNFLSSNILISKEQNINSDPASTLYITFHLQDGNRHTVKYQSYGVKSGLITSEDFTYFTPADVESLWTQTARKYWSDTIRIDKDPFATEIPVNTEHNDPEIAALDSLIRDYFSAKEADFQSEEHLNLSGYYHPEIRDRIETQTSWKVFRFEKLVRYTILDTILWENFHININDIELSNDTATVNAYEYYEYVLSTANGLRSSRGTNFSFNCRKINNTWYIESIETDNDLINGIVEDVPADALPELVGID